MKKLSALLLSVLVLFSAASCGRDSGKRIGTEVPPVSEISPKINSSTVIDTENTSEEKSQLIFTGEKGGSTPSGLMPLPKISFRATENTKGLSEKKLSHSHGPSADGKVHHTVEEFQKTFLKYGGFTYDNISEEKVLLLHKLITEETGGDPNIRDLALLDSALESAFQTFDGQELYPTKEEKGARIGYSLISNHAFVDGNKRIGMYVLLTFLEVNGIKLRPTNAEVARVGLAVAAGEMKYEELLDWILENEV